MLLSLKRKNEHTHTKKQQQQQQQQHIISPVYIIGGDAIRQLL